jgi:hypothetical protein
MIAVARINVPPREEQAARISNGIGGQGKFFFCISFSAFLFCEKRMAGAGEEERDEMQRAQELVNQLQVMKDEATAIAQKISELDQERHEHSLVAETLQKLDSDRKCFRLKIMARLTEAHYVSV